MGTHDDGSTAKPRRMRDPPFAQRRQTRRRSGAARRGRPSQGLNRLRVLGSAIAWSKRCMCVLWVDSRDRQHEA